MTDNRVNEAGNFPSKCVRLTCILDEGAITQATTFDMRGQSQKTYVFAAQINEGDIIGISNDAANTYANTGSALLVEKPVSGETLVVGRVISLPEWNGFPATDAAADTLAERLSAGLFRTAIVEFWPWVTIKKAEVYQDGTNATVVGVGTTLKLNMTATAREHKLCLIQCASGGTGVVPLQGVAAGTAADLSNCIVAIEGMMTALTGA